MIKEPVELVIGANGEVSLPLGLLVEAGLDPGASILAYSAGDGQIVLRRPDDAYKELFTHGTL